MMEELVTVNKKELPEGWRFEKISEIVLNQLSGFACAINKLVEKDGYVQLRPFNIQDDGNLNLETLYQVPMDIVDTELYFLKKGDILFNNTNSTELVGKSALIDKDYSFAFSNHINRIRVETDQIIPEYFHCYLRYIWSKGHFARNCKKWIGQSGYTVTKLKEEIILLPPKEIQQKIVENFEKQMAQIEIMKKDAEKQLNSINQLPNSILNDIFENFFI